MTNDVDGLQMLNRDSDRFCEPQCCLTNMQTCAWTCAVSDDLDRDR